MELELIEAHCRQTAKVEVSLHSDISNEKKDLFGMEKHDCIVSIE